MSGHTPWSEIRKQSKATPEQRERARRELDRELTLAELRRARELTQSQLAAALETNQSGVSRIERQTDLYLSTLRSYVQALGGELELIAIFPDGTVQITGIDELAANEKVPA